MHCRFYHVDRHILWHSAGIMSVNRTEVCLSKLRLLQDNGVVLLIIIITRIGSKLNGKRVILWLTVSVGFSDKIQSLVIGCVLTTD